MKIGNLELENNILFAPMAGVSDLPFRCLCREQGTGLTYTEMVSAKAIYFKNKKTKELLQIGKEESPAGVQLFGSEPELIAEMANVIDNDDIALFDINMGCPVPKIVNNNEGSALMKNPELIGKIVKALKDNVKKPVTIKIRKGFNDTLVNAVEVAKIAEFNGVDAITVHGRTREQYYMGEADWGIIKSVKDAVNIPVIGNGDIFNAGDAKNMLDKTGCDGVMVARGARGNPWIFREINHYLKTGELLDPPTGQEIKAMIARHGAMLIDVKGEYIAMRELRKHVSWYTKGMKNSAKLRKQINEIEKFEELEVLLKDLN